MKPTCRNCGYEVECFGDICDDCVADAYANNECPICRGTGELSGANAGLECPDCYGLGTFPRKAEPTRTR